MLRQKGENDITDLTGFSSTQMLEIKKKNRRNSRVYITCIHKLEK